MSPQECTTCGGTGTVLDSGPSSGEEYGRIHEEPVLEPCPGCADWTLGLECTDAPEEETAE